MMYDLIVEILYHGLHRNYWYNLKMLSSVSFIIVGKKVPDPQLVNFVVRLDPIPISA
jgi:hypothetical protein